MKLPGNLNVTLGINVAAGFAVCVLLGHFFDIKRGRGFWGIGIGSAAGLFYAIFEFWKFLKENQNSNKNS